MRYENDWDEPWSHAAAGASEAANEERERRLKTVDVTVEVADADGNVIGTATACVPVGKMYSAGVSWPAEGEGRRMGAIASVSGKVGSWSIDRPNYTAKG